MPKQLSKAEIDSRMVELRNLRSLHANDRKQVAKLNAENKELRALLHEALRKIDAQNIRIAELETMVFGKKKRPPTGRAVAPLQKVYVVPRASTSYRRPIPSDASVTETVVVPLPTACACGGSFDPLQTTTHTRYVEDIPLPELTPGYHAKLVTKYLITHGVCIVCGKVASGRDLGGAEVSLGRNIRLLAVHLVSFVGLTYSQVACLLLGLYNLSVSDGELASICQKQHQTWLPAYNTLAADIRAAPVTHGDESPWPIRDLQGGGYAWVLCDAYSPKVCFALEQGRGAAHAKKQYGQGTDRPFTGIRITDDYGPYRSQSLPGRQQLCWAHLYRAIRDVRYNDKLPEKQLAHVRQWYEAFSGIYQDLRNCLAEPYDGTRRTAQAEALWRHVQALAEEPQPSTGQPDKLARLKAQLLRAGKDRLFACLPADCPCDNNRAERDLRQLVLKRKRSFGSKSEKGAQALATLVSLCTTTWRMTPPQNYFKALSLIGV